MRRAIAGALRAHPVISGVFAVLTIAGAVAGALYLPAELHLARRVVGGAIAGSGCALLITAHRMLL